MWLFCAILRYHNAIDGEILAVSSPLVSELEDLEQASNKLILQSIGIYSFQTTGLSRPASVIFRVGFHPDQ